MNVIILEDATVKKIGVTNSLVKKMSHKICQISQLLLSQFFAWSDLGVSIYFKRLRKP